MFISLADKFLVRVITRAILLHLCICVGAIAGIIMLPFSIWDFVQSVKVPSVLLNQASVETVHLINRDMEGWNSHGKAYICYLDFNPYTIRHARRENPKSISNIQIYKHDILFYPPDPRTKIIEVSESATWDSIYFAAHGQPLWKSILYLIGQILLTILGVYLATRGYWLIKHGRRKRPKMG